MNNKKLKKEGQAFGLSKMVTYLSSKGYHPTETRELISTLFEEVRFQLSKGNHVVLKEVCTIRPVIKEAGQVEVGGATINARKRLNLKIRISENFSNNFKDSMDPEVQLAEELKKVKFGSKR